jgi:hypothetical protein
MLGMYLQTAWKVNLNQIYVGGILEQILALPKISTPNNECRNNVVDKLKTGKSGWNLIWRIFCRKFEPYFSHTWSLDQAWRGNAQSTGKLGEI